MPSTAVTVTPAMEAHLAVGHDADGRAVSSFDFGVLAGEGALRSSATDMLSYAAANLDAEGGPLHAAMAVARVPRNAQRIGLGWNAYRAGGLDIVSHGGATAGFSTFIALDEVRRTAVVVLSNSRTGVEGAMRTLLECAMRVVILGPPTV